MKLYSYWRSSTAYRARIALELKQIPYEIIPVNIAGQNGEHLRPDYLALNPQGRVPTLALDDGTVLIQSPAILEYLEERYPTPALLPADMTQRAHVRAICAIVACDIHPLNNVRTLHKLRASGQDEAAVLKWVSDWIHDGLSAVERLVGETGFCLGDTPTLADVCLIPQIYNARRFEVPLDAYPRIRRIERQCLALDAFARAQPQRQPDAVPPPR